MYLLGNGSRGLRPRTGNPLQYPELQRHAAAGRHHQHRDPGRGHSQSAGGTQVVEPETTAFVCGGCDSECLATSAHGIHYQPTRRYLTYYTRSIVTTCAYCTYLALLCAYVGTLTVLLFVCETITHYFGACVYYVGLPLCREIERQSMANLHILGSKLGECMQTAVHRLSDKKEGDPKFAAAKYT